MNPRVILGHVDPEVGGRRFEDSTSKGYGGWTHNAVTGRYFIEKERTLVEELPNLSGKYSALIPEEGEFISQSNHSHLKKIVHSSSAQKQASESNILYSGNDEIEAIIQSPKKR